MNRNHTKTTTGLWFKERILVPDSYKLTVTQASLISYYTQSKIRLFTISTQHPRIIVWIG